MSTVLRRPISKLRMTTLAILRIGYGCLMVV